MIKFLKYLFGSIYFIWLGCEMLLAYSLGIAYVFGVPALVAWILSYFTGGEFSVGFMVCFIVWGLYLDVRGAK